MEHSWQYVNPVEILFKAAGLKQLDRLVPGEKILLVTTRGSTRRGLTDRVRNLLGRRLAAVYDNVTPNPQIADLEAAAHSLSEGQFDSIIGLGGGSAIDSAKTLSVLLTDDFPNTGLKAVIQSAELLSGSRPLDLTTVPTTHGTGGEVTPFATLWDGEEKQKYSLSGPQLFPRRAIVDPQLTLTLPDEVSISTALDALSQGLEALWNHNRSAVTDLLAAETVRLVLDNLQKALQAPDELEYRTALVTASLLSGLAISQTKTALAHSISYPLTAHLGIPHGLACSITVPAIWEFNCQADPASFAQIAARIGFMGPDNFTEALKTLLETLEVERLVKNYLHDRELLFELVDEMYTPDRAGNNFRPVERQDIVGIVDQTASWLEL